jgi:PIN domain nuclease of toxin-antitoxin system
VKENAIALVAIDREHALDVAVLSPRHGDRFDRLLVAQAIREGMTLVSRDTVFDAYPVRRVW